MTARIYQPARNAMTSGMAKTHMWVLEFSHDEARKVDPLMGWTGSGDMQSQVKLKFDTCAAAEDYAKAHGIDAAISQPHKRKAIIRAGGYGENFATYRRRVWTH